MIVIVHLSGAFSDVADSMVHASNGLQSGHCTAGRLANLRTEQRRAEEGGTIGWGRVGPSKVDG